MDERAKMWYSHTMPTKRKSQKIRKAVIPVAGFGTRFLPATIAQPKEMLPIVDKPIIQYIVEEMVEAGIEEIIFITGRNKRAIEDHFDYSGELEHLLREGGKTDLLKEVHRISRLAKFVYVRQNKMFGSAHAVLMAKDVVGDEPFAFSFGDDVIESRQPAIGQLMKAYQQTNSTIIGTMAVKEELIPRYGIIKPKGRMRHRLLRTAGLVEKPAIAKAPSNLAVIGRYVFTPDIFGLIERTMRRHHGGEVYLADPINIMARQKSVYAYEMSGRYFDCGSKREYIKANIYYALKHREMQSDIRAYLKNPE